MAEVNFGEVDWNSVEASGSKGKTAFMQLKQGPNVLRVMGNPIEFSVMWLTSPSGEKFKVNTPVADPALVKKLQEKEFKIQKRWLVKVLDRSDEQFKLLEIGSQVCDSIKKLVQNPKWGPVTGYDLTITRAPAGTNPLYNVQPDPKEALDSSLKEKFAAFNKDLNVDRLISPSEPEYVMEKMGMTKKAGEGKKKAEAKEEMEYDFE